MRRLPTECWLLAGVLIASGAHSQVQRSGGGESQRIMQQYQQLAAERTALQAQVADLKKQLDAANAQLTAVKKERDLIKAHPGVPPAALAQANAGKEAADKALEQSKARMTELIGRFRDTVQTLRETEADRNKARQELADRTGEVGRCDEDNAQLIELGRQVLDRYEHIGPFTRVSSVELFTQITRTRLQNFADEYREKMEQLKVKKSGDAPHAPANAPRAPAQAPH
jgi:chromosome segregation ATPase